MKVELNKVSINKGDIGIITVYCDGVQQHSQIQVEIYNTGVLNPSSRLGYSAILKRIKPGAYEIELNSKHLKYGTYEVKLIRFHTLPEENFGSTPEQVVEIPPADFFGGRDFRRLIFEVVTAAHLPRKREVIERAVFKKEECIERDFLSGIDVRNDKERAQIAFCVFVFIKGLLIGSRMRLHGYEIIPASKGMDSKDSLECINDFLANVTSTKLTFKYEENLKQQSRRENPVCVAVFHNIIASDFEEAGRYCEFKAVHLIRALTLIRDAGGEVFDVVVHNRDDGNAKRYTSSSPYRGNLLTGSFSGENPDTLENYSLELERDPFKSFLVNLYKEARREANTEFQYVRYWQILETLAESRNFNPDDDLIDFEGNVLTEDDGKTPKKIKGSVNSVYSLFRESGIGGSERIWRDVKIWFSFRNSVAHHGSIWHYSKLSIKNIRKWAEEGIAELEAAKTNDPVLWRLKEDVKYLLQKEVATNQGVDGIRLD